MLTVFPSIPKLNFLMGYCQLKDKKVASYFDPNGKRRCLVTLKMVPGGLFAMPSVKFWDF